jgi:CYTH domain-containing protein
MSSWTPATTTIAMTDPRTPSADDVRRLLGEALRRPAQEGARLMALHWLHQLVAARALWEASQLNPAGEVRGREVETRDMASDALHKARVALRRLRATLRENDRVLDGAVDRRLSRALSRLGQATNAVRDADVQRAWLETEEERLPDGARDEARRLRAWLDARTSHATDDVGGAFAAYLDPIEERLFARLSSYQLLRRVGLDSTPMPFARHLATRVGRAENRLRRDIERITDVSSQAAMHEVRIRLKRQRALLAPFARSRPAIGAWFDLATRGQDVLGAIRDADLLAHRARKAGLRVLAQALSDNVLAHFAVFQQDWCERLDDVMRTMDAAANALRGEGMPMSSNGLPMEIERKYLLRSCPPAARTVPPIRIEQGWIPGQALRERLRRRTAPDGSVTCWRTVKLGPAEARVEVEEITPPEIFDAMWGLTRSARVRKDRYVVPHGAHTWEIDVFLDRDLALAEVELGDVHEAITLPPWLAPYLERDVTGEPAYFNAVLARPEP